MKSAPAAVQGQRGDDATYSVACALVIEFGLPEGDAWDLLCEYNRTKCSPAWSDAELQGKLRSARNMAAKKPGEVGRLLGQDRASYSGPAMQSATAAAPRPAPVGQPKPVPQAEAAKRTARTVFFEVTRAGCGAKRAQSRTLRTLTSYSLRVQETGSVPDNKITPGGASEVSGVSEAKEVCAEASEPSVATPEPKPSCADASEVSGAEQGRKSGGIAGAFAARVAEAHARGNVVTWVGASGKVVRWDKTGRPRAFGQIKD